MSSSVAESSDIAYSSTGDQLPTVTAETQSSCIRGIENEESTGESSNKQVSSMVGWTVFKKYGIYGVDGVLESFNSVNKIYDVRYKDGKSEKVTEENVIKYLFPCRPGEEQLSGSALLIRAENADDVRPVRKAAKRTRAATAPAQPSRRVPRGSAADQVPPATSGSEVKKRYRSLRMNPGC